MRSLLPLFLAAAAFAAPTIPAESIAKKGELLFADDFSGTPDKRWVKVVPTFGVEEGALEGVQTRLKDEPTKDGKGVIKAHAAMHGLEVPTKDSVVEVRIKLDGASMVDVELDDRKYTAAHYGHICRAQVRYDAKTKKGSVQIIDERDGGMKNEIRAMLRTRPARPRARSSLVGRSVTFPATSSRANGRTSSSRLSTTRSASSSTASRSVTSSPPASPTPPSPASNSASPVRPPGHSGQFDDLKIYSASAK
jgi:hypothetical protein